MGAVPVAITFSIGVKTSATVIGACLKGVLFFSISSCWLIGLKRLATNFFIQKNVLYSFHIRKVVQKTRSIGAILNYPNFRRSFKVLYCSKQ